MGYTHHFTVSKNSTPEQWGKFCMMVERIIEGFDGKICNGMGEGDGPEIDEKEISLNGCAETGEDHETFHIKFNSGERDFCKTARKPYDSVVVVSLVVGKALGIIERFASDGNDKDGDFDDAKALMLKTVPLKPNDMFLTTKDFSIEPD